jgi:Pyruvate/2-oxoacid:ferredoxin oxidoreductase gamma subunit
MRDAVKTSVPAGTEDLNLKAFDAGWNYYDEQYNGKNAGSKAKAAVATG